ncbi:UvrD-helicase domain-containing protein [Thalassotalea fonticola]|nr:UvrD-helicase domain-containing protein [Colwelliaceae bacterium S1-1]
MTNREELISTLCPTNGEHIYCDKCQTNGKCRVKEKTDKQINYILSPIDESIFLKACPGSGKTEVVAMKAAYEISKWQSNGGIAILSFTNNAADVIHERVSEFMRHEKVSHPHFIGTFDSWLHGFIAHPFLHKIYKYTGKLDSDNDRSYRIIDEKEHSNSNNKNDKSKHFLNNYILDTPFVSKSGKKTNLCVNNVRWEGEWELFNPLSSNSPFISVADYFNNVAFEEFRSDKLWLTVEKINNGIIEKKRKFNKKGFATYNDIEWNSLKLFKEHNDLLVLLSKRFPLIIIDEAQDLSKLQLSILKYLKYQGSEIHFVGDLQQAIYEFKKVDPVLVKNFVKN